MESLLLLFHVVRCVRLIAFFFSLIANALTTEMNSAHLNNNGCRFVENVKPNHGFPLSWSHYISQLCYCTCNLAQLTDFLVIRTSQMYAAFQLHFSVPSFVRSIHTTFLSACSRCTQSTKLIDDFKITYLNSVSQSKWKWGRWQTVDQLCIPHEYSNVSEMTIWASDHCTLHQTGH